MPLVLLIDDDPSIRRLARVRFEQQGYAIAEADSAFQALEMIKAGPPPDAVVCDIVMPGMTGIEFYRHLVEQAPRLHHRVVFLTAVNRDPAIRRDVEQLGVPLLSKLDDLQLVVDAVRVALLRPLDPKPA
jgi:CheY-like chemotaxis protein